MLAVRKNRYVILSKDFEEGRFVDAILLLLFSPPPNNAAHSTRAFLHQPTRTSFTKTTTSTPSTSSQAMPAGR
jgi:hypothetical protein